MRQHGTSQRRTWRKLHLAFDQATNEILATELTTNAVDDASMLKPLLEIVTQPVAMLGADGAYDRVKVYDELALRQIRPLILPRVNARIWTDEAGHELAYARNEAIRTIESLGLAGWKQAVGYHRRSKAETGRSAAADVPLENNLRGAVAKPLVGQPTNGGSAQSSLYKSVQSVRPAQSG